MYLRNKLINPRINIITTFQDGCQDKRYFRPMLKSSAFYQKTLNFNLLLKNHFECSFVSFKCSLQSSNACFEVRSEYIRRLNSKQFDWLTYYGSQSELAKLAHRKLSERTSKQTLELCNEHSEFTNEHSQ